MPKVGVGCYDDGYRSAHHFDPAVQSDWHDLLATYNEASYQVLDGLLVKDPNPRALHQAVVGNCYFALRQHVAELGRGCVLPATEIFFSQRTVLRPDVCYLASSRPRLQGGLVSEVPQLVIEVLEGGTTALQDAAVKRWIYAEHGVAELWLVDPARQHVVCWQDPDGPHYLSHQVFGVRQAAESRALPGLRTAVAQLLAVPRGWRG